MATKITKRTLDIAGAVLVTREDAPGVEVYTYTNANGLPCAYGYRSARTLRHDFHNHFQSETQRDHHIARFFDQFKDLAQYRAKKAEGRKRPNPFQVRDILAYSWGYDQTNVDFYQVVGVKGRQVVIREIKQETVDDNAQCLPDARQSMAEYVVARRDAFLDGSEPMTKLVQFDPDGSPYLRMDYGRATAWNGGKKYQSHYA